MGADVARLLSDLDFDSAKSIRYHAAKRNHWARLGRASKVVTIASGASVLITFLAAYPKLTEIFAISVSILSLLDLVLDFARHERLHDDLYRRFSRLEQKIVETSADAGEITVAKLRSERLRIEADEPGVDQWLERRCSRDEALSRGAAVNPIWEETRWDWARAILRKLKCRGR